MIKANNPNLTSWIDVKPDSDFPIQNLPFGIYSHSGSTPKVCTAIGNNVVDLSALFTAGLLGDCGLSTENVFNQVYINDFMALGKQVCRAVRNRLSELLESSNSEFRDNLDLRIRALIPMNEVEMKMPVKIGDYTDFYSSKEHATNVGTMFRDPANALLPNWLHLPVGYHGRASSIIVSGEPIHRPKGQMKAPDAKLPSFGPCKRLDFELEMAFITCKNNPLGNSISAEDAENSIFGFVLFNDWSARDVQTWEYVPLGPFMAKNFASSISPWIVTMDALEPFRINGPKQKPEVLPYLKTIGTKNFDISLEVGVTPEHSFEKVVCRSNFKNMYWNVNQQLAHHTVNGCNIKVGDMYASGTISGPTPESYGSMLELAWKGTKPISMPDGTERKFLHDGDTVVMRGYAKKDKVRIGFGEVRTLILPAK